MKPVTQKAYDKARKELAGYRADELNMRIVERGALEFGRKQMRKRWMEELASRGFADLADYLGTLIRWEKP